MLKLASIATTCPVRPGAGSVIIRSTAGGSGADVVIRVEQDHCVGAHGDDCRDGVGDLGESARPPEGTEKPCLCGGRRRADRERTGGGGGGSRARADRAIARQGRSPKKR